ncbi:rhamnogalacturonan acetylesterase [Mucilaginibacter mali]|uniref:Rhamnogalacturonan acetylesterase n=1 Tax=Mucilaginibacter mali TaxID=2740462 RepID=A0A7D4QK43_9SPHI|nr:rhamnogalacturonan acetylesterase [Mucilaginibacter mali]
MRARFKILLPFLCSASIAVNAFAQEAQTKFKFDFGSGEAAKGYTKVTPQDTSVATKGYGFDFGSKVTAVTRDAKKSLTGDYITADKPFYFSVNVPEGNYKVTVTLGDIKGESTTTVRAESRRLMLEKAVTGNGDTKKYTFIVNIRKPQISTGGEVKRNAREIGKYDWDDKLTLEFNDSHPCVDAVEVEKVDDQITIFLAGNSTVVDQDEEPWCAWGQMITRFLKPGVAVADHAESGLTLGSFLGSHRLDKVLSVAKPGDYLFIEFGHNDQKEKGPNDGAYKSYTERFKLFINRAREKQMIPVIVTSTARRNFNDSGHTINNLGDYPDAARKVAKDMNVALIDVNAMTTKFYEALGKDNSTKAFVHYPANTFPGQTKALADNTHFNSYGAYEIAKCVMEGIKSNHLGIEKFIIDKTTFDPSHPDTVENFSLPMSGKWSVEKPAGN